MVKASGYVNGRCLPRNRTRGLGSPSLSQNLGFVLTFRANHTADPQLLGSSFVAAHYNCFGNRGFPSTTHFRFPDGQVR